jgi:hypothetical protein
MKKLIAGVEYDTEHDKEVAGEFGDDSGATYCLYRTITGQYYILKFIPQVWIKGRWENCESDTTYALAGIKTLPDPRTRHLETIRPVSRTDAIRWYVASFAPEEFQKELFEALESKTA